MKTVSYGPTPWQQASWDWRAAANFMGGGMGSGLVAAAALAGTPRWTMAAGALLVALGLLCVWFEIGRPWRALNVMRNPTRSWMTREALVALAFFAAVGAAWAGITGAALLAALLALAFVYAQARILQAAKGIPAWREPSLVPLVVATGLAEGCGALLLLAAVAGIALPALGFGFALVLVARLVMWTAWRRRIAGTASPRALQAVDAAGHVFKAGTWLPLAGVVVSAFAPPSPLATLPLQAAMGALALVGGLWFKYTLVTRAAYNQGFALPRLPVRGVRRA